jgi:hypothetical protein
MTYEGRNATALLRNRARKQQLVGGKGGYLFTREKFTPYISLVTRTPELNDFEIAMPKVLTAGQG